MKTETGNRLLIVEGDKILAQTIKRNIERSQAGVFDHIFLASNVKVAEHVLASAQITVLFVDCNLEHTPRKTARLSVQWRHRYKTIQNVFLYSDGDLGLVPKIKGIDAIFAKAGLTVSPRNDIAKS